MIQNSFVFLERIGLASEKNIWSQGVFDWNDFLGAEEIDGISRLRKRYYDRKIMDAKEKLFGLDASYFAQVMPVSEVWRLYDFFYDECVFLDIETSGYYGDVTVVGLYDGVETKVFVKGFNLDKKELRKELSKYKMIVTFNGLSYDVPVLKKYFGDDVVPEVPHFDLRHACSRIRLNGGLKRIEKILGIKRIDAVENLQGEDATYLWQMWKSTGNRHFLDMLVKYNEEDIVNLKPIADFVFEKLKSRVVKS